MKIQVENEIFGGSANIERYTGGSADQKKHFEVSNTAVLENYPENLKNA